jgi:hypothetical protein
MKNMCKESFICTSIFPKLTCFVITHWGKKWSKFLIKLIILIFFFSSKIYHLVGHVATYVILEKCTPFSNNISNGSYNNNNVIKN